MNNAMREVDIAEGTSGKIAHRKFRIRKILKGKKSISNKHITMIMSITQRLVDDKQHLFLVPAMF